MSLIDPRLATEQVVRATELTCSCGGLLNQIRFVANFDPLPPRHRKKRIRKKLRKRWEQETRTLQGFSLLVGAMAPPSFRCVECNRFHSYYAAMGRNLFTVEPMPPVPSPYGETHEP